MESTDFKSSKELEALINFYFEYINESNILNKEIKSEGQNNDANNGNTKPKILSEQISFSGLAHFLGFSCKEEFDSYCIDGKYARALKRGRLKVEEFYEKKLVQASPAGAIFALKNNGWNDKTETRTDEIEIIKNLKIELIQNGPEPAGTEKEVII